MGEQKSSMKPKDLEKMYEHLVKETDKVMEDLRKLLQKQKNEEEQVLWTHPRVQESPVQTECYPL